MAYHEQLWEHLSSIEFQAAFTVFEKHKRSKNLNLEDLKRLETASLEISEARKIKGKTPNLDFLIQEVGKSFRDP